MRVPEQRRAGAQVVVDVLAACHVPHVAAFAAGDDEVELPRQDEKAEAAAGEIAAGGGEKLRLAFGGRCWNHAQISL